MALYNTVPAEDLRQESPKSIKKIVVVCSDDGCNCRCPPWNPSTPFSSCPTKGCDQSHCHDKTVVKCDGGQLCGKKNLRRVRAESSRRTPIG